MIGYTVLKDGVVVRTGMCNQEDLEHQAGDGETVEEGIRQFEQHPENEHWSLKRKKAYPPLEVFADAFYHFQNGNEERMNAYLAACEQVKQSIPKE